MSITYQAFWNGFNNEKEVHELFEYILQDIKVPKLIYSVFGSYNHNFNGVKVYYSGEAYFKEHQGSINLNMNAEPTNNAVSLSLFALNMYRNNNWEDLKTRKLIKNENTHTKFCSFIVNNGSDTRKKFMLKLSDYKK